MTGGVRDVVLWVAALAVAMAGSAAAQPAVVDDSREVARVHAMIKVGDATAVPIVRQWIAEETQAGPVGQGSARLRTAIAGAGAFRLDDAGAALASVYDHAAADPMLRGAAIDAAASIGTPGARKLLAAAMDDQSLALRHRAHAAAALVGLNEDRARTFLIERYEVYLVDMSTKSSWDGTVRGVLELLADEKLMRRIEALRPAQTDQRARNNVTTLLDGMRISGMDAGLLMKLAEDDDWARARSTRYDAIRALGRTGTPDLIPRLEALRPWANGDGAKSGIQQRFVNEYRDRAIAAIRCRHWDPNRAAAAAAKGVPAK